MTRDVHSLTLNQIENSIFTLKNHPVLHPSAFLLWPPPCSPAFRLPVPSKCGLSEFIF